jgi:serine/threonine-protein phosphatase 4 regulatory subunit 2
MAVNGLSSSFEWKDEHQTLLEQIATDNEFNADWKTLRDVLKHRIHQNVTDYFESPATPRRNSTEAPTVAEPSPPGSGTVTLAPSPLQASAQGLVIPPFPPRPPSKHSDVRVYKSLLEPEEAREAEKKTLQLLDQFEENPPFTIQRVCELALNPREHYRSVGKYLRAVERSLLVTSTWDQYTRDTYALDDSTTNPSAIVSNESLRHATTPLFSPIPFHPDNQDTEGEPSSTPPMSPFTLETKRPLPEEIGPAALGRVDEMDDPTPGHDHMADHPTAISAVTDLSKPPPGQVKQEGSPSSSQSSRGIFERSKTPEPDSGRIAAAKELGRMKSEDSEVEDMVVDDPMPTKDEKDTKS